jgi:hypothetical protein
VNVILEVLNKIFEAVATVNTSQQVNVTKRSVDKNIEAVEAVNENYKKKQNVVNKELNKVDEEVEAEPIEA